MEENLPLLMLNLFDLIDNCITPNTNHEYRHVQHTVSAITKKSLVIFSGVRYVLRNQT